MKTKHCLLSVLLAVAFLAMAPSQLRAQTSTADSTVAPRLEHVLHIYVNIGKAQNVGPTTHGQRVIIPITGGKIIGNGIDSEILPGGADYQLVDHAAGRVDMDAIYSARTSDGCIIRVR